MHRCDKCAKTFTKKCNLLRHIRQVCDVNLGEGTSNQTTVREKRDDASANSAKRARKESSTVWCDICSKDIKLAAFQGHLRSNEHKTKACCTGPEDGVDVIRSTFKERVVSYRISTPDDILKVNEVMASIKNKINNLMIISC